MCGLRVFSFTKSPTFNTRLCFTLGIFALVALLATWLLNEGLDYTGAGAPERLAANATTRFLAGTGSLRAFWVVIAGFVIALILGAAFITPTAIANGRITYGAHDQYKGQARQATTSAAKDIVGINKGIWVVNNGTSQIISDQSQGLESLGGPATLIVQDGHAVILEKAGQYSRTVGSGLTQLDTYERVAMIVPLTLRSEHLKIENVATKDKILIELFEMWAFHKVLASDPASSTPPTGGQGRFPFDEQILLSRIWTMSGKDWRESVRNVAETAARDVVGRHTLEEILPLADTKRTEFKEELRTAINRVTRDLMGVDITAVDFGEVRIPAEVRDSLQTRQVAVWRAATAATEVREAASRAQAEAIHLRVMEAERAAAQRAMMVAISEGISKVRGANIDPSVVLNMRLIEALEKMAENPATKFVIPTDVLQLLEQMRPVASTDAVRETQPGATREGATPVADSGGNGASAGDAPPA
jgi:hypothetical protein